MKRPKLTLGFVLAALGFFFFAPVPARAEYSVTVFPTDDTYVDNPDTGPHGDEPLGYIGEGGWGAYRAVVKFELPELPPGSAILHAQLSLYCYESDPLGLKRTISVHHVPPEVIWDEETATWDNPSGFANSYDPVPTDSVSSHFWAGWLRWNVTTDVANAYGLGPPPLTVLFMEDGHPVRATITVTFTEYSSVQNQYSPRLDITYDPGGTAVKSGAECWTTEEGSVLDFNSGLTPIPTGFFGPGSDPFDGIIALEGHPPDPNFGATDTVVARTEAVFVPDGDACQVQLELVALDLISVAPIRVTYDGGMWESFFDVYVELSAPSPGQATVSGGGGGGGGSFVYDFFKPTISVVFANTDDPAEIYTLPIPGPNYPELLEFVGVGPYEWETTTEKDPPPCGYDGFYATGEGPLPLDIVYDLSACGHLLWSPPKPVSPLFGLISLEDWEDAWGSEQVQPMTEEEGEAYKAQFNANLEEGEPYPDDPFLTSGLYLYESNEPPSMGGLVMYWGEGVPDGNYAAAWKYVYEQDPDLSNCILAVTVEPPCGMLIVSLGLKDINGNVRAWYWNVAPNPGPPPPGMIQCSPGVGQGGTTIRINLSQTGVNAATPMANSYSSNPAFDIRNVSDITFDEDNNFVGATQAPTPGSGLTASWNYWYNLMVTPGNPPVTSGLSSKHWIKWSQRPVLDDPNLPNIFIGWNEYSNYNWRPIVADDWLCTDDRPITDIHWWGSYFWWTQPTAPPVMPQAFHIGIWSDVPAGMDPCFPFSHPGMLIWENFCDNYVWSFAGYDSYPGLGPNTPTETCFQFNQLLSEDEWFYQDPCAPWDFDPRGTVYWLSIAAIYSPTQPWTPFQWGWKTRKPSWNDDAVVIFDTEYPPLDYPPGFPPPNWPPSIGVVWKNGTPIEFPAGTSWDMAFELTTNQPGPNDLIADINGDGVVDFKDFARLALEWLKSNP